MPDHLEVAGIFPNGENIKFVVESAGALTIHMRGDELKQPVTDAAEITYLQAYMTEKGFFQVGLHHYNPRLNLWVETDPDPDPDPEVTDPPPIAARVVDIDGDINHHNTPAEIAQLQAAAAQFVWQPTPP